MVDAPVGEVFGFHERADALQLLSPAFPPVRVIRRDGGIAKGARVELQIGPFRWVAVHTAFELNSLFVDEQITGPFARWIHRHEFQPVGRRTRMTDRLEYLLPGGRLINILFGRAVGFGLIPMFRHRHAAVKRFCELPSLEA